MKSSFHHGLIFALCAAFLLPLSACSGGTAAQDSMSMSSAPGAFCDTEDSFEYAYSGTGYSSDVANSKSSVSGNGTENGSAVSVSSRKLIKNVSMDLETKAFDSFIPALEASIDKAGGYIQDSAVRAGGTYRYASITARIPAEGLDAFTSGVSGIANVVSKNENTEDVTLSYYDMESHVKALRSEYDTLLGILEKCTELTDVISVQSRITEVLYQIESYQSRLNNYDNLVAYSTVTMYISEVERETVVEEQTMFGRIADGFARTVDDIAGDAQDLLVGFVVNLPYILIWAVILAAAALAVRVLVRRLRRRPTGKESENRE